MRFIACKLAETYVLTQALPTVFRHWGWNFTAVFVPKASFLFDILPLTFRQKQISATRYDALAKRTASGQPTPLVDFDRYDYSAVQPNELGVEKALLVRRFKKSLVRIVVIADDQRRDIRDLLLALYSGKAYGRGFAIIALNMPLDSFQGKNTGVTGLELDGRDAEALAVMDGMLMFGPPHTSDLTTAPMFVELLLEQWGSVSQRLPGAQTLRSVHPDAIKYYEAVMLFGHALDSLLAWCGSTCIRSELNEEIRKQAFMSLSGQVGLLPGSVFRSEAWLLLSVWGAKAVPVYKLDIKNESLNSLNTSAGTSLLSMWSHSTHAAQCRPIFVPCHPMLPCFFVTAFRQKQVCDGPGM
jgi:hypothetical protein